MLDVVFTGSMNISGPHIANLNLHGGGNTTGSMDPLQAAAQRKTPRSMMPPLDSNGQVSVMYV